MIRIRPGVNTQLTNELNSNFEFLQDVSIHVQDIQDEVLSEVNRLNTHFSRPALSLTTASTSEVSTVTIENIDSVEQFNTSFGNIDSNVIAGYLRSSEINNEIIGLNTENGNIIAPINYSYIKGTEEFDIYEQGIDTSLSSKLNNGYDKLNNFNNKNTKILTEAITQLNAIFDDESEPTYSSSSITLETVGTTDAVNIQYPWAEILPDFSSLYLVDAEQKKDSTDIQLCYINESSQLVWGIFNILSRQFTELGRVATSLLLNTTEIKEGMSEGDFRFGLRGRHFKIDLETNNLITCRWYTVSTAWTGGQCRFKAAIKVFSETGNVLFTDVDRQVFVFNAASGQSNGIDSLQDSVSSNIVSVSLNNSGIICFYNSIRAIRFESNYENDREYRFCAVVTFNITTNAISSNTANAFGFEYVYRSSSEQFTYYLSTSGYYAYFDMIDFNTVSWNASSESSRFNYFKGTTTISSLKNRSPARQTFASKSFITHLNTISWLADTDDDTNFRDVSINVWVEDEAIKSQDWTGNSGGRSRTFQYRRQHLGTESIVVYPNLNHHVAVNYKEETEEPIKAISTTVSQETRYFCADETQIYPFTWNATNFIPYWGPYLIKEASNNHNGYSCIDSTPIINDLFSDLKIESTIKGWEHSETGIETEISSNYKLTHYHSPIVIYEVN